MKLYAIVTLPDNTIHHDKVFVNRKLAEHEISEHGCVLDTFSNIVDNGTIIGKLVVLKLIAE